MDTRHEIVKYPLVPFRWIAFRSGMWYCCSGPNKNTEDWYDRALVQVLRNLRGCKTQIWKFCSHCWCFKVVNVYHSQSWYKLHKSTIQVLFLGYLIRRYYTSRPHVRLRIRTSTRVERPGNTQVLPGTLHRQHICFHYKQVLPGWHKTIEAGLRWQMKRSILGCHKLCCCW